MSLSSNAVAASRGPSRPPSLGNTGVDVSSSRRSISGGSGSARSISSDGPLVQQATHVEKSQVSTLRPPPALHSQVPGTPTFRSSAVNAVSIIPLLSTDSSGNDLTSSYSVKSFQSLLGALARYAGSSEPRRTRGKNYNLLPTLVISNSQLTRPGDWRYDSTPLKSFDWSNGCQRIQCFDGRPDKSRMAYDRLLHLGRIEEEGWTDLIPSRGTAAVVGVLNVRDCPNTDALHMAEDELTAWAERYSRSSSMSGIPVVTRMFVFDSFDEESQKNVDLTQTSLGSNLVAFPPSDEAHTHMMDLHLNVVINDLAVAIFKQLEERVRMSDSLVKDVSSVGGSLVASGGSIGGGGGGPGGGGRTESNRASGGRGGGGGPDQQPSGLGISAIASIVSPRSSGQNRNSPYAAADQDGEFRVGTAPTGGDDMVQNGSGGGVKGFRAAVGAAASAARGALTTGRSQASFFGSSLASSASSTSSSGTHHHTLLQTPLDEQLDLAALSPRESDSVRRREAARREKHSADLSLLAGSPIDAYERYTRAADLAKNCHDPLWYASSLEGCAASFVAMAEAGGHSVDEYLENNFQLPEELMAVAASLSSSGAGINEGDGRASSNHGSATSRHGSGSSGGGRQATVVDRTKTTMPAAVYALAEESLSVLSRHPKLASLKAELLLKMAKYAADDEESHLRCRWGEGEGCFDGGGGEDDHHHNPPLRWEITSVSRIDLSQVLKKGGLDVTRSLDAAARCGRFAELLHGAASVGGLDARTRADVAAACARMCLTGVKEFNWGALPSTAQSRLRLPRKAAFFTTVAAEAMSQCPGEDSAHRAASLWLAACYLYSKEGNGFEGGEYNYGWANLRASTLHGLSMQEDHVAAEVAAEYLLALLSEISPDSSAYAGLIGELSGPEDDVAISDRSRHSDEMAPDSRHSDSAPSNDQQRLLEMAVDSVEGGTGRPRHARGRSTNAMQARSAFFVPSMPSAVFIAQSKWMDDDPISNVDLPLLEPSSLATTLVSLNCVIPKIRPEKCTLAQKHCIVNLSDLRQGIPTASHAFSPESGPASLRRFSVYGGNSGGISPATSPLVVTSGKIVKSESHLLLDRTRAAGYSAKSNGGSMATFFNPYANKKNSGGEKSLSMLVSEGEERTVLIEFQNRLSIPLEVPSCQLAFDENGSCRIEAPPLSFTVPGKSKNFAVHFPFVVLASKYRDSLAENEEPIESAEEDNSFEAVGLQVACLNRMFFMPFNRGGKENAGSELKDDTSGRNASDQELPESASVYQRRSYNRPEKQEEQIAVRMESVPAQPHLLVSFTTSQTPIDDGTTVPVHLSDGEIYTIPSFRLENDFGPSGMGKMERLQIVGVGLPGLPDEVLFDTDELAAAREGEEDEFTDSESSSNEQTSEDFVELMECDGLPPLKMKALTEGLSLKSINDKSKSQAEGNIVTFQIAATHDMGNQLANGGNVRIRFRYRGPSPNPATEIWRKREVCLRIVRVKGPRISSLTFRSDLSWGSAYSELCMSLAQQKLRWEAIPRSTGNELARLRSIATSKDTSIHGAHPNGKIPRFLNGVEDSDRDVSIVNRVGTDQGVHVSSDEVVVLMAVANETNSTIILSNRKGRVGGFEGSPMPTVRVTSGVSVKIPVVIPRIDRLDESNEETDIAAELIARTALQWESEVSDSVEGSSARRLRQGRVRIPSRCLREIIDEHQSFSSRICKPPVSVKVSIGNKDSERETLVQLGSSIDAKVDVTMNDWVPADVVSRCSLTMEFCCARKGTGLNVTCDEISDATPYVICGKLRRTVSADGESKTHQVRIAFFQCGTFVVSACAKVSRQEGSSEEVWWAPLAETVRVAQKI